MIYKQKNLKKLSLKHSLTSPDQIKSEREKESDQRKGDQIREREKKSDQTRSERERKS